MSLYSDARWILARPDPEAVDFLSRSLGICRAAAACLVNRGISDPAAAQTFIGARLSDLDSPDGMADMDRAVERAVTAVRNSEKVAIFGDYDVDGVSSAALVAGFFKSLGLDVEVKISERFVGYGMDRVTVEEFAALGCSLIVAVDCGTSDHEAADRAAEMGIDLVVIDHHRVEGEPPQAFAFVNPQRKECRFRDKSLASVGLAFYFAAASRTALCEAGLIRRGDLDVRSMLDLVALGTVADVVPFGLNNRILVKNGLRMISSTPRPGIEALMKVARIRTQRLRSDHIAFQLAPRLNAAGRMGSASLAFDLLMSTDRSKADSLAHKLDRLSKERRLIEDEVVSGAKRQLQQEDLLSQKVLVVSGDGWHRGVLGIVAARMAEKICKPVYVVGFHEDVGTGSARGHGQIDLHASLSSAADYLVRFGGHRDAAGFTLLKEHFDKFKEHLAEYSRAMWKEVQGDKILCDAQIDAVDLTSALIDEIEKLGPFGPGFSEPVFEINGLSVRESRIVGDDHLKLNLVARSANVSAFGPKMGNLAAQIPEVITVAATIGVDDWKGDGSFGLKLMAPPAYGLRKPAVQAG